jgi:hypothetical protein
MTHKKILVFILIGAFIAILFPAVQPYVYAQDTISISPTSGPPGTAVTIRASGGASPFTYCEANGSNVGTLGDDRQLGFTITQQSGTVEITCMYDSGQEFTRIPVGSPQYFTVTQPVDRTIRINRTSGPPGTVITLSSNVFWDRCFVGDNNIGVLNGSIPYTIPGNATGTLNIVCYPFEGPGSNTLTFRVDAPQAAPPDNAGDADRDGVPDASDRCPYVSGQGDQFGGVTGLDGCPVDSDADGTNDGLDHCPFEAGPPENSACPTGAPPAQAPAQEAPPAAPQVTLPGLPADGICNVATASASNVNLRGGPTTDDEVVGQLTYTMIATATAVSEDGQWFQLSDGAWVASWVVRHDGECSNLPSGSTAVTADGTVSLPADWESSFEACPALLDSISQLPAHLVLDLMYSADPCGDAESLLGELVFFTPFEPLSGEQFDGMLAECPVQAAALADFLDHLAVVDPALANRLQNALTAADRCTWGQAMLDRRMPPVYQTIAMQSAPTSGLLMSPLLSPPEWAVIAAVECVEGYRSQNNQHYGTHIAETLITLGFTEDKMTAYDTDMCRAIEMVSWLSDLNTHQLPAGDQALYDHLVGTCGLPEYATPDVDNYSALHLVSSVRQYMADPEAILADENLCQNPLGTIESYAPLINVAGLDPSIPSSLRDCPQLVDSLRQSQPHIYTIYTILMGGPEDGSHCGRLETYLEPGVSLWPPVAPDCAILDGMEVLGFELADGTIIDKDTPWHELIAVFDRPDVCAPLELPARSVNANLPGVACYAFTMEVENTVSNQEMMRAQLIMTYGDGREPTIETAVYSAPLPGHAPYSMAFTALVHDPDQSPVTSLDYQLYLPEGTRTVSPPWLYEVPMDMCRGLSYHDMCELQAPEAVYPPDNAIIRDNARFLVRSDPCADSIAVHVDNAAGDRNAWYHYNHSPFRTEFQEYLAPNNELDDCTTYTWRATNFLRDENGRITGLSANSESAATETRTFFTNFSGSCTNVPTCSPATPEPASPTGGEPVVGTPILTWTDDNGCPANSYEVEIALDPDFTDLVATREVYQPRYVPLIAEHLRLQPCATHYWRVRGTRTGQTGAWSETGSYILNPADSCLATPIAGEMIAPTLLSPINEQVIYTTLPSLQWEYNGGIQPDSFSAAIYTDPELTNIVWSGMVSGSTNWWMPTMPLDNCAYYYWNVTPIRGAAYDAVGGPRSATGTFTVECSAETTPSVPDVPTVMHPWPDLAPGTASSGAAPAADQGRSPGRSIAQSTNPESLLNPGEERYGTLTMDVERYGTLTMPEERAGTLTIPEERAGTLTIPEERAGTLIMPEERAGTLIMPTTNSQPSGLFRKLRAFLMGSASPADLYYLEDGDLTSLTNSPAVDDRYPVLSPAGDLLAFLSITEDGPTTVNMLSVNRRLTAPIWGDTDSLSIIAAAPAWSPLGDVLLLTLQDAEGSTGIYALDMRNAPNFGEPTLLIADAAAPVFAPNGRYLAFEREIDGMPSVVVALAGGGQETVIDTGLACQSPTFGENSIDLFFTCMVADQSKLYHYGLEGLLEVALPLDNVYNPSSGPSDGYLAVDDGSVVYFVAADGSDIGELIQLPGLNMTNVRWAAASGE